MSKHSKSGNPEEKGAIEPVEGPLKLIIAQLNFHVGDIDSNKEQILQSAKEARDVHQADVVIFPELALTGYPPEDLLLRPSLQSRVENAINEIKDAIPEIHIILGHPYAKPEGLYNAASVLFEGKVKARYFKCQLPNYQVFDEKRYFVAGHECCVVDVRGTKLAINICEDIWFEGPAQDAKEKGADCIVNINASPFHLGKMAERKSVLSKRASELSLPIVYAHCVGGQDELVFDGGSMIFDANGRLQFEAPRFKAGLFIAELVRSKDKALCIPPQEICEALPELEEIYQALVLGVRDYVNKNRFKGVILGLSGGIDSALTLAIATDALGSDRVEAVMMPFRYTSKMSIEDAGKQAKVLGVEYQSIAIESIYQSFMDSLSSAFKGLEPDTTEENLQARCRGVLLMAISNKKGYLVLTTGNKSEMAVGYSTLYGDMAGGFDVLKDLPKMTVFALSRYINERANRELIPQRVIERPPSAELAPDQKDEDSLPPYEVLDRILELYIEQDESAKSIIDKGFNRDEVYKVLRLVDVNEYKRRQAPIGVRVSARAFGKDRRYPITNAWRIGE